MPCMRTIMMAQSKRISRTSNLWKVLINALRRNFTKKDNRGKIISKLWQIKPIKFLWKIALDPNELEIVSFQSLPFQQLAQKPGVLLIPTPLRWQLVEMIKVGTTQMWKARIKTLWLHLCLPNTHQKCQLTSTAITKRKSYQSLNSKY